MTEVGLWLELSCGSPQVTLEDRLNNSFSLGKLAGDYERLGAVFAKLYDGRQDMDFWSRQTETLMRAYAETI